MTMLENNSLLSNVNNGNSSVSAEPPDKSAMPPALSSKNSASKGPPFSTSEDGCDSKLPSVAKTSCSVSKMAGGWILLALYPANDELPKKGWDAEGTAVGPKDVGWTMAAVVELRYTP